VPEGHIVVIGAMGSGKSSLGRRLATALGREMFDSDVTIQSKTGRSGREIAESEGVPALHELEQSALLEALDRVEPSVIAAAASVVDDPGTREKLEDVFCVWVRADAGILEERTAPKSHRRTVATSEHLETRNSIYSDLADLVVDTGSSTADETAERVLAQLEA
jgi:shikimate kinase